MTAARRESRAAKSPSDAGGLSARRSGRGAVPTDAVIMIDKLVIYLKPSNSTVYKLAQEGEIPGHKVGRHWRLHCGAIDQWLLHERSPTNA